MGDTGHFAIGSWQTYGVFLLETLAALAIIGTAAWILVRYVRPRVAAASKPTRIQILERVVLEPRRSLYLVEVDGRTLLVGAGERSIRLIAPVDPMPYPPNPNRGGSAR